LQEIDNHITRLKRERENLDNGDQTRAEKDTLAAALAQQEAQLNLLNTNRISLEGDLEARETKLNTQQTRLMNAKTTHEVQSLERDIAALTTARGELDEKVLLLMDEIDQCASRLDELRAQHQEKESLLNDIDSTFATKTSLIDHETDTLREQRETLFATLLPVEQTKYETTASRHHGIAVAHLHDGACSACGTALTPFNLKEAKTEEWPTCDSCRRLLYVKE
jgi:predicted  nucleic acid-binding Zn-ribbon protein